MTRETAFELDGILFPYEAMVDLFQTVQQCFFETGDAITGERLRELDNSLYSTILLLEAYSKGVRKQIDEALSGDRNETKARREHG